MKITSAGSAQTTGKPFDLRINDSGSSTNFFVVNNGTKNVYTRDGCFYIDGAGTLCMDSTGYKLMGWLADKNTGEVITSGDVTALSIMDTPNLTSPPEATENAYASGIIDKDTPDLSSTQGYTMALEFYDDLGYPYSARFTVRLNSDDGSAYTVKLSQILDQNGVDVLKEITEAQGISLDKIFGKASTGTYSLDAGTPYVTDAGLDDLLNGTYWTYDTDESTSYAGGIIGHLKNNNTEESLYFNANGVFYYDKEGKQPCGPDKSWGNVFLTPTGESTLVHPWSNLDKNTINISTSGKVSLVQIEGANSNNILKENWYFLDTVYEMIITTGHEAISSAGVDLISNVVTETTYPEVLPADVNFQIQHYSKPESVDPADIDMTDEENTYYASESLAPADKVTVQQIEAEALSGLGKTPGTLYVKSGAQVTTITNWYDLHQALNDSSKIIYDRDPDTEPNPQVITQVDVVNMYLQKEGKATLYEAVTKARSDATYYKDVNTTVNPATATPVTGTDILLSALSTLGTPKGTLYRDDGTKITENPIGADDISALLLEIEDGNPIYDDTSPLRKQVGIEELVEEYKSNAGMKDTENLHDKVTTTTSKAVYYTSNGLVPPTYTPVTGDEIVTAGLAALGTPDGTLYLQNGTKVTTKDAVLDALSAGNKLYDDNPVTSPSTAKEVTSANIVDAYKSSQHVSKLYEQTTKRDVKRDAEGNPLPAETGWPIKYGDYEYPNPAEKNPAETWAGYFVNINTNRMVAVTVGGTLYEYDKATDTYVASSLALDSMLKDFDPDTSKVEIVGRDISATYTNYDLTFSKADGSFQGIDDQDSVYMFTSALGPNFHNVSIDFTALRNANNGKKSTAGMDSGTSATNTTGAGKKLGSLVGVAVQNDGRIYGSYDNGNTVLLGQIASAHFANASGLEKIGESCYNTTLNSGDAVISDISADGSSMTSGEIEMSNVDLSAEFTDMITTQRGFQANSRVITTSDTLLEELINLKR